MILLIVSWDSSLPSVERGWCSIYFLDVCGGHATDWYLASLETPPGQWGHWSTTWWRG